jgi:hypothetical protein
MGAVAAIGGAIAGPIIGGVMGQNAADTQAQGAQQAAQTAANAQLQGLQLVQQQEAPYNQAGQLALGQYERLLGLGGSAPQAGGALGGSQIRPGGTANINGNAPGGSLAASQASGANFDISKLPGYAFEMQQGQQALQNSAAARGQALSGNTIQATQQFGQGLASTQFQQYMQQLAGLANLGQASASNTANQGASLLSGAGASLASGQNAAAGYNAAGLANWGNQFQTAFNSPAVQGGLQQGLSSLFSPQGIF